MLDKSESELRAALGSKVADERFMAAFVVGEKRLRWPQDLIPLLEDPNDMIRLAARRSLVILSFLELNPEEAALIAAAVPGREPTPLSKLKKPVDFGPASGASKTIQKAAVDKWTAWWADRDSAVKNSTRTGGSSKLRTDLDDACPVLADAVVKAEGAKRTELVSQYRDAKGVQYTEALASAITKLSSDARAELRDALAARMIRMTDGTLGTYLKDSLPEIRRAAALGLAKKGSLAHIDRLAELLVDPEPLVRQAGHTALCQLTKEDFGPESVATEAERVDAMARWKKWWQSKKGIGQ